jgi:hypothetical protein
MWRRDPGVSAMIEYLDKDIPLKFGIAEDAWHSMPTDERMSLLSPQECMAIYEQGAACMNDFSYAARNYFWISTKKKVDVLMSLTEGQHLILQKFYDLRAKNRSQKILIVKARQLGCSTLIEAMIAWRSMFYINTNAIVVANDKDQSAYLFDIMSHIYDMMPWWLKPAIASRKYEQGLIFDNPDASMKSVRPGMRSRVMVAASTQFSGVGEGRRVDAAHVSEFAGYDEDRAVEIIDEDLGNALDDNVEVFAFAESTAKGAGTYAHRLWRACISRAERAEWYPLFLPWFFETTRVLAPPKGWHPGKKEGQMAERVKDEWLRCDNPMCKQYRLAIINGESGGGTLCHQCNKGFLWAVELTPEQLYWKEQKRENAEVKDKESLKKHLQEMATTGEEAFQISGHTLFNEDCHDYVNMCVRDPIKAGRIYRTGEIHGAGGPSVQGRCYIPNCTDDHRYDDTPFLVWEEPVPGAEYIVGVDVSEGIGEDYSVIFVNKKGRFGAPDEQVAVWKDNHTPPKELAFYCDVIGRWYNEAMMCIEYNTYQTCGDDVVHVYQYPNVFIWKSKESRHMVTTKWHWWTRANTKSYLHQTAVHWLKNAMWKIRSKNFAHEMTVYKKDEYDSRTMGAAEGFHDDELMAGMISLYCAHELDADESGRVPVPARVEADMPARYDMCCEACNFRWKAGNPEQEYRCPKCESIQIRGKLIVMEDLRKDIGGMQFDSNGRILIEKGASMAMASRAYEKPFDDY